MRNDLVARGADFQNGWRGDVRPRLFLPVPGCPIANRPDVPACSYARTVDVGSVWTRVGVADSLVSVNCGVVPPCKDLSKFGR